jgi:hypothetical protein
VCAADVREGVVALMDRRGAVFVVGNEVDRKRQMREDVQR